MSRPKRNVHFSESYIKDIQHWADCEATLKKMYEMFSGDIETADIIESENCTADSILRFLVRELKIEGKPDMDFINNDYEYYENLGQVRPEYRREE